MVYGGAEGVVEKVQVLGVGVGAAVAEGEVMATEEIEVEDKALEDEGVEETDVDDWVLVLDSEGVVEVDAVD